MDGDAIGRGVEVLVLKLICWRVLCGFKDIRGVSRMKCDAVKGHAVWSLVNGVCGIRGG